MLSAQTEFERRTQEIEEYFTHLRELDARLGVAPGLMNTLKSSVLLMTYNIVESTMTNLLQDMYDHMQSSGVTFDELNELLKIAVLGNSKRRNPKSLVDKMRDLKLDFVAAGFERSEAFSGNLDSKVIRELLVSLGIRRSHSYSEVALKKVREERDHLAHGVKSFSDCGRAYTVEELSLIYEKTAVLLGRVISDFEAFIDNKDYR